MSMMVQTLRDVKDLVDQLDDYSAEQLVFLARAAKIKSEKKKRASLVCNLCGLSCVLSTDHDVVVGGLLEANVSGGYHSTPGNGYGALDDCTNYNFNLCEWCLDWLFSQFTIPIAHVQEYSPGDVEYFVPAHIRVQRASSYNKKWKEFFFKELKKRNEARDKGIQKNKEIIDNLVKKLNMNEALE